jgi:predicted AlkP superfamily pyrophosphatase or phosphodiesterase
MRFQTRTVFICLAVLALLGGSSSAGSPQTGAAPKLVVVVVVDQMRGDYLTRYADLLGHGLTRLTKEGAWFRKAAYPYLNTVTCTGHTTIGTGELPYHHGMVLNQWWDRAQGRPMACTEDPSAKNMSVDGPLPGGDSAINMLTPTFAEVMRKSLHGRTVTISLKARSAIGLAGHEADAVVWLGPTANVMTSSAYGSAVPPFAAAFAQAHPAAEDSGRVWDRSQPIEKYRYKDDAPGEQPGGGWTAAFPHPLGGQTGGPGAVFYAHWEQSPYSDDYLERLAEAAVDDLHLGAGDAPDFLGVSFSALDLVGHTFGPRSHEVQDVLARLDLTIDRLLTHLDAKVGQGKYVLALSADHGVADVPEQIEHAGRQNAQDVTKAVETALQPFFGTGPFVAVSAYTDLYFKPGVYDRLKSDDKAMKAVIKALEALPGIEHVLRSEEIATAKARQSSDKDVRAAALSYYAGRSGDLILVPRENWLLGGGGSGTTHGTLHEYDQHVPIVLFGACIKAGAYDEAAAPPDIAATLASIVHVPLPATDGRVLTTAVLTAAATK